MVFLFYKPVRLGLNAVFSVQSVLNQLFCWIKIIQYSICISLMRSCKNNNLEMLVCSFKTFYCVRTNIDSSINYFSIWKFNLENDIWIISVWIVDAMNKSFIKIENNCLLMRMFGRRELYMSVVEVICLRRSNCVDVLNCLKSLY